jgi:hypothetical protein
MLIATIPKYKPSKKGDKDDEKPGKSVEGIDELGDVLRHLG